jgi:hypothetical protein
VCVCARAPYKHSVVATEVVELSVALKAACEDEPRPSPCSWCGCWAGFRLDTRGLSSETRFRLLLQKILKSQRPRVSPI